MPGAGGVPQVEVVEPGDELAEALEQPAASVVALPHLAGDIGVPEASELSPDREQPGGAGG